MLKQSLWLVLVTFWACWDPSAPDALNFAEKMHLRYRRKGLTVVSICASRESQAVNELFSSLKLTHAVAVDEDDRTADDWMPDGYPDYYVVDRWGHLRVCDVANGQVESVLKALLSEGQD